MSQILKVQLQKLSRMSLKKNSEIQFIKGSEGTQIKQYFHPGNTTNRINYSLAQCTLESGKKSTPHKMKSSEIYYILEGTAIIHIDKESFTISKDDSIYVSPMSLQFIENVGKNDLRFLCIVEPAWKQKDEII